MGWRDTFKEEDDKKLPEMTTIFDAKTQSVQLILWSDYVGKGYQAFDLSQRARLRRTQIKRSVAKDELLPEEVEGCDIAHPFRDFMAESLRETNEKVKFEMEKNHQYSQSRDGTDKEEPRGNGEGKSSFKDQVGRIRKSHPIFERRHGPSPKGDLGKPKL